MSKLLYAPGPVRIPDKIKYRMLTDPPYFTTTEFSAVLDSIQGRIKDFFGHSNPMLIGTGSGTLGLEATIQNFFSPGDNVLLIDTGKYGANWGKIAMQYGLNVISIAVDHGEPVDLGTVESILKSRNTDFRGILVTHTETTTGVVNDIEGIKRIRNEHALGALLCVDAVSSLLTENFTVGEYDVVISASQKALQCPPGLFFMFVSDSALSRAENSRLPKFYFDVINEHQRAIRNITTFTPASTTVVALDATLKEIDLIGGPQSVILKSSMAAKAVRDMLRIKFTLIGNEPNAVTAFYREGSKAFAGYLEYNYNLVVGTGVQHWSDTVLRIMHFGWDLNIDQVTGVARAIVGASDPYP